MESYYRLSEGFCTKFKISGDLLSFMDIKYGQNSAKASKKVF